MNVEEFRARAEEPVTGLGRLVYRTTASELWVAVYRRVPGRDHPTMVWSMRLDRPAGKTEEECLEVALHRAMAACANGDLVAG